MKFTVDEIKEAQVYAAELKLYGWEAFEATPPELLVKVCNGTGAEWMPKGLRYLLDVRHPTLKVPVMLHDLGYYYGLGSDADFHLINDNLYENGCIVAKDRFWWCNPRRYFVMWDAAKLAKVCDMFGKKAYEEAIELRHSMEPHI